MAGWRRWPGHLATALVLATLLFGKQIATWSAAQNRYHYMWRSRDGWVLIGAIVLLALALLAGGWLLAQLRPRFAPRLAEAVFLAVVAAAVLPHLPLLSRNRGPHFAAELWLVVGGALALGWWRWGVRLVEGARRICLALVLAVPLLMGQILSWRGWDARALSHRPAPPPAPGRSPVVLIIFDEWSWFRAFPEGRPAPGLDRLRWLTDRALLAREARSPGPDTRFSLPRLMFQGHGEVIVGNGTARWRDSTGERPSAEVPSLFDEVHALGYRSVLRGNYLPYRGLLGIERGADDIVSFGYTQKGASLPAELGIVTRRNLEYWTDPVSRWVQRRVVPGIGSDDWAELNRATRRSLLQALEREPDNTFVFGHLPLPHAPFIFDRDGSYLGRYRGSGKVEYLEGYLRHLGYADHVLGEILDVLERTDRFDRTLLIVTADHGWRKESDSALAQQPDAKLRVPLLIKWPGQTQPMVSDEPLCLLGLGPIIEAVMRSPPGAVPPLDATLWEEISRQARGVTCRE